MTESEVMIVGKLVSSLTGEQVRVTRVVRVEKAPKRKGEEKRKKVASRFLAEGGRIPTLTERLDEEVAERVEERKRNHAP